MLLLLVVLASTACRADDEARQRYDYFFMEAMMQRQQGHSDAAFDLLRHCVEIDSTASETYYYLAQYYSALKDKDKSLAYVQRAADLEPDNATYLETLANLYMGRGQYAEAIAATERLYEQNKDREDLLETLFELYQQTGDNQSAIDVVNRLETIDGKSERLSYAKSELYSRMGDKEAAMAEMQSLAEQFPNDLHYQCLYADMLMMNGEQERALELLARILSEDADYTHALMSMRAYYQAEGDSLAADSVTTRVLGNAKATSADKIYLLRQEIGDAERQGGDSLKVLRLFREALAVAQQDADVAILCAAYMNLKNMPEDSIRPVLERILELAPDNTSARLQLVASAWEADDLDRVIDLCQAARQYNPDEMAFYYYQGMAYYKRDERDEALSTFQNGISVIGEQSNPTIVSDFYAIMGDLLHQQGLTQQAFEAYDSCLQWKEDNLMCLNNYAYYLSELGTQLDKAEQMSYKTIKAEPQNATFLDTYAWILFMQRRYSEAKIYIDQALQNDSAAGPVVVEHAGDIYAMNHETERAVELWRQALKETPRRKALIRKIKLKKYIKE